MHILYGNRGANSTCPHHSVLAMIDRLLLCMLQFNECIHVLVYNACSRSYPSSSSLSLPPLLSFPPSLSPSYHSTVDIQLMFSHCSTSSTVEWICTTTYSTPIVTWSNYQELLSLATNSLTTFPGTATCVTTMV